MSKSSHQTLIESDQAKAEKLDYYRKVIIILWKALDRAIEDLTNNDILESKDWYINALVTEALKNYDPSTSISDIIHKLFCKKSLKDLCSSIGCSGTTPGKCPGNPDCDIVQKIVKEVHK